jgi:hypothetical protein
VYYVSNAYETYTNSPPLADTPEESLLYGTPGGAVEVVFLIVCGWAGDKYGYRILISMTGLCTAMLGMILIVALPLSNNSGRLAGYYLTQASPTPFVALLSLISSNVAGTTKKTTVAAMYLIGYCVGNIIGKLSSSVDGMVFNIRRPANVPTQRCASLCPSVYHHNSLLGRVSGYTHLYPLLLCVAEQEEGTGTGIARVREDGEPGVSFLIKLEIVC